MQLHSVMILATVSQKTEMHKLLIISHLFRQIVEIKPPNREEREEVPFQY